MTAAFAREGGYGAPASVIDIDSSHPDHINVPDAQLLFTADFRRAGPDLILTGHDGRHHIIPDYFATEKHPALTAPNGASLASDLVDLLAGSPTPNEYAQAQPTTAPDAIGKVEKVVGNVTVIRNGASVALNVGDAVYKSDVIQTGTNSAVGIGFPDGTALNLVDNTRMALNDYSFDPNSTSNTALFSLVEGTFSFVAGKVAHTGDMKMVTPVATMGIRGTTGWVQEIATISANVGNATYSFAVTPDYGTNQSGIYDLFDQSGNVIATVSQTGFLTLVTPQGIGASPSVTTQPMTPAQLTFEQQIIQQVFQTLNLINNPNPQTNPNGGSGTQPSGQNNILQQLLHENGSPFNINNPGSGSGSSTGTGSASANGLNLPTPTAYWLYPYSGNWNDPLSWSDAWAPLSWQSIVITEPVTVIINSTSADSGPTSTAALNLLIGLDAVLEIVSGGSLTVSNIVDVFGTLEVNSTSVDPSFTAQGPVTVETLGEIEAIGSAAAIYFSDTTVPASGTYTVDNFGIIAASDYGAVWFEQATTKNEAGASIVASDYGTITFDQGSIDNFGTLSAGAASVADGTMVFEQVVVTNEAGAQIVAQHGGILTFDQGSVTNFGPATGQDAGEIEAETGGIVTFNQTIVDNFGVIDADAGTVTFEQAAAALTNESGGVIEAENGGTLVIDSGGNLITNAGMIAAQDGSTVRLVSVAIDNTGSIELNAAASSSTLQIGVVTLEGGGQVTLGASSANFIVSDGSTAVLTNVDNIISGAGAIGDAHDALFTLINETSGVIDATATNALVIDNDSAASGSTVPTNAVVNTGLIEATGTGGLTIENTTIDNAGVDSLGNIIDGTVEAAAGSHVALDGATILHGFVSILAGGEIETVSASQNTIETANGPTHNTSTVTIDNAGILAVSDNSSLTLASPDAVENSGTIELNSTGDATTLSIDQGFAGLNGGGKVVLSDSVDNVIAVAASGDQWTNFDNTISGAGTIGAGGMALVNNATIDADDSGAALTLDPASLLNTGTLEATDGATLVLNNTVVTNTNGTITVAPGASLDLTAATIHGGTIDDGTGAGVAAGTINVNGNSTIDDNASLNNGDVTIGSGVTLTLDNDAVTGTTFTGTDATSIIQVDGTTPGDTLTLTGVTVIGGTLKVASGATLDLYNTQIVGVTLSDLGTINVFGTSTVDSYASVYSGQTNVALGQTLFLNDAFVTGIVTNDGTLQVDGGNSAIFSDVTISGGALINDGTVNAEGSDTLSGEKVTNSAAITVAGSLTLTTATAVTNSGGTITVDGGGTLTLDDSSSISGGTVTVDSGATLTLNGTSGLGGGTLINDGTVNADGSDVLSGETVTNTGAIVVADSLTLKTATAVANSGGTITVDGGSTLTLDDSSSISGGTIENGDSLSDGTIEVSDDGSISAATINYGDVTVDQGATLTLDNVTLDDVTLSGSVSNAATLTIDATDTLTLSGATITGGTIDDAGTIKVSASSEIASATVDGGGDLTVATGQTLTLDNVTLDDVTLSGSVSNTATLTIDATDTLTLSGAMITGGTIDDAGTIAISASSEIATATVDGGGDLTVATGQTLTLDNVTLDDVTVSGSVSNTATLTIDATDTLTLSGATITGGTIDDVGTIKVGASSEIASTTVDGGGDITVATGQTLTLDNVTLDGVTLSGSVSNTATLTVDATDTLTLSDATITGGTIDDAGSIKVGASSEIASATVDGGGDLTVATGQTLTLDNVTLDDVTLSGSVSNTATLTIDATDTLTLNGATITGGAIDDAGSIAVSASSEIASATVNGGGDLTVATGQTLTLDNVTLDGVTQSGNVSNTATLTIDATDTLTLNGATVTGGTIDDAGNIAVSASSEIASATINGGGDLSVATGQTLTLDTVTLDDVTLSGSVSNTATLTIDGPDALTLSDATVTGGTIDDAGNIAISASSEIASATVDGGGDLTVATGQTLTLDNVTLDDVTLSGSVSNTATLTIDATDALTLNVATITGGTIDDAGSIAVSASSEIASATINGGGDLTVATGQTLTLDNVTLDDVTLSGSVSNTATLTIDATDTLTLSDATITGGTIDDAGTIKVGASSEIASATVDGGGDLTVATGQTLTLDNVTLDDVTLSGSVSNTATLTIDATDTLTLSDATITGGTIDDAGTIAISTSSEIASATINGGGDLTVASGQTLTLDAVTLDDVTLSGSVSNTATLTIDATDTLTLNGATITGGTIDDAGTIAVSASSEIASATVDGGGDLTVATGQTLTLDNVTLDGVTLTGSVSNTATLTIDGPDTLTLSGATITGGTIDDAGTIAISTSSEIASATVDGGGDLTVATGQTLTLDAVTLDDVTLSGGVSNTATLTIDATDTLTLSEATITGGTIADVGSIAISTSSEFASATINGGGDLTVATGQTLTLDTVTLDDVTLSGSASNTATLTIDATDTLTLSGATITGGPIDDVGGIAVGTSSEIASATVDGGGDLTVATGQTLTLDAVALDDVTLSGSASNTATLTIDATDTLTLSGATITGGTIDDAGTIAISASSEIANATVNGGGDLTVATGQTLTLDAVTLDDVTLSGGVSNTATLTIDDSDTLTLSGTTITGGTITDNGTIDVTVSSTINGNAGVNGGQITVENATLTLDDVTLSGTTITEETTGSLVQIDSGDQLTLEGGTVIGGGAITNLDLIEVAGAATLSGDQVTNSGTITVDASDTLVIENATTITNSTTADAITVDGTLTLDDSSSISGGTVTVASGGTIDVKFSAGSDDMITASGGGSVIITNDSLGQVTGAAFGADASIYSTGGTVTVENGSSGGTDDTVYTTTGSSVTIDQNSQFGNAATVYATGAGTTLLVTGGSTFGAHDSVYATGGTTLTIEGGSGFGDYDTVYTTDDGTAATPASLIISGATTFGATDTVYAVDGSTLNVDGSSFGHDDSVYAAGASTATVDGSSFGDSGAVYATGGSNLTIEDGSTFVDGDSVFATGDSTLLINDSGFGSDVTVDATGGAALTIEGGAVLAADDSLALSSGAVTFDATAIAGFGALSGNLNNAASIEASGGTLDITGLTTGTVSATIDAAASLLVGAVGTTVTFSGAANAGTIEVAAGTLDITGPVTGIGLVNGSAQIDGGATLALGSTDAQTIAFEGAAATLQLDTMSGYTGDITGFAAGDMLDLRDVSYGLGTSGTYTLATGILSVTDGSDTTNVTLEGDYSGDFFKGSSDGHGGTLVTLETTDDAPAITQATSGSTQELANQTGDSTDHDIASGTITFTDVDLTDRPVVSATFTSFSYTDSLGQTLTLDQTQQDAVAATEAALSFQQSGANDGSSTWTYSLPDDTFDFLAQGETLTLTYTATVNDERGDSVSQPITVTITGTNDAPTIVAGSTTATGTITELANQTGDTALDQTGGTLTFADVDLTDTHTVSQAAPTFSWSGGTLTTGQISALTADGTLALTETDSTGSGSGTVAWSYSAADDSFDFLAQGETLTVTYDVTVTDNNGATAVQPITVTVTGTNDAPTIVTGSTTATGTITELANQTGDTALDHASGTIAFADVDLDDTHTVSQAAPTFSWSGGTLTTGQISALTTDGTLALTETDSTGSGAGTVAWSYSAADASFDFLAQGETLTVTYDVTVTDNNGATAVQPITVTVTGTNDAPTIVTGSTTATGTITELANQTGDTALDHASGTIAFADVDLDDIHTVSQAVPTFSWSGGTLTAGQISALTTDGTLALTETDSTGSGAGTVAWSYSAADASFDFLAQGETLTVTYDVTVTDNNGATAVQPITVTVTGTNDAPTIVTGSTTATGTITELANQTGDTALDHASGTIAFADVDLDDTHTVSQAVPTFSWSGGTLTAGQISALTTDGTLALTETDSTGSGAGTVAWSYSAADASFDFLAQGETLTVTYDVTVTDNNGAAAVQPITVTVTGTNDQPVITSSAAVASVTEQPATAASPDTASGTLSFNDVDLDDTHTAAAVLATAVWSNGSGTIPAQTLTDVANALTATIGNDSTNSGSGTLDWNFSLPNSDVEFLAANETLTLTYDVTVADNSGSSNSTSAPQTVTVTVTGTNDAPTITSNAAAATGSVVEDGAQIASGQLTYSGPDLDDTHTWTIDGGNRVQVPDYQFAIDRLTVTKNGTEIFNDTFGTAPPSGPNFLSGNTPSPIFGIAGGTFVGATGTAGNTTAGLDGSNAAFTGGLYSDSFGQFASLNPGSLLSSHSSFTTAGLFDLIDPPNSGDSYGIRLTDRASTGASAQPGVDTVELAVVYNASGQPEVRLREIDDATGTSTTLATAIVSNASDDQIQLSLTNSASNNGVIQASYQLYNNGVPDGGPVTFSETGSVFENGETTTRLQFFGLGEGQPSTAASADSILTGTYGTLDINQSGQWTYALANGQANVEALAPGQVVQDTFNVQVADNNGGFATQQITINVTGADVAPTITSGATQSVVEGTSTTTPVFTATATDVLGAPVTYSLSGADAPEFSINPTTGAVTLNAVADYQTQPSYSFNVVASDGPQSSTQAVTVAVTDVAPTITSSDSASVVEGTPITTPVFTAAATDVVGSPVTYSLSGTNASEFSINATTGAVTLNAVADYQTQASYSVNVVASDGTLSSTQAVTVAVTDVAPTITSSDSASVVEGTPITTPVFTAAATDVVGSPVTYSLSGTNASEFSINATTGAVTLNAVADYQTQASYSIDVVASDGTLSSTQAVTVAVTDVAPTITSSDNASVVEGTPITTPVFTAAATDVVGSPVTYSLSGTNASEFSINATTGAVTLNAVADYQTQASYSIDVVASDGTLSSTQAVTVAVTDVAPTISTSTIVLATTDSFGGSGEHQGAAVTYADGALYLSYNNGPSNQNTTDTADIVAFNTATNGAAQAFTYAWNDGDFFGVAADGSQIYAAGESYPGYGLTTDNVGGVESKSIFVRFDADGTAGNDPSPALGYTAHTFYSYSGVEGFQNVIATTQSGSTILYAFGFGQPESYSGYVIGEYNSSGTLLATATDPGSLPGGSVIYDAADWSGGIWAAGTTQHSSEAYSSPTVWDFSYNLSSVATYEDNIGASGAFNGVAAIGNELYAAGYANVAGGQDYLLAEYNTDGSVAWTETFASGSNATNVLTGTVSVDGRLFAVGYTVSGGTTEGVLMEINPSNGDVISTQTYDAAAYNTFTSITTDGHYLYVGGVSGASSGSDQAVLLTYDIGGTSATTVEDTAVALHGLSVSDAAASGAAQFEVTLAAGDGSLALENDSGLASVTGNGSDSVSLYGTQSAIDTTLADGVIYDPTAGYTGSDAVTITANDGAHGSSSTGNIDISIAAADSIATGAIDTVSTPSGHTVLFDGSTGTLDLVNPSTFTGEIAGITGTGNTASSDVLDLNGFNWADTSAVSGSFDSTTDTTPLIVTDSSDHQTEAFTLIGNYTGASWTVTSDNSGGADIVDPPSANFSPDTSVLSSATADGVSGNISFADSTSASSASFTPDGADYVGSFSVGQVTESNGTASVAFDYTNDQINLAPGETLTQSYNVSVADAQNPAENVNQTVSVSIGGPGNDNFVFAPGIGADTVTNFNPQQDTIELDHFANVQTVQELQSLITTDAHGDALINLGHNDSITLSGTTAAQLQQVISAGHVLLH